ncbi:hypothetical protein [Romboutsia sp.]
MENKSYKIADISKKDEEAIKKAENMLKNETNKNFVIIAWEKNN